jgi:hypothetical protein
MSDSRLRAKTAMVQARNLADRLATQDQAQRDADDRNRRRDAAATTT